MNNLTDKFRPPKTKVCTGCKKDKPLKEYYLNGESRDGRHSKCGDCLRTIEHQKKAKRKEQAKTFFDAKLFTLFLLLSVSLTAFGQDKPEKLYLWPDGKWSVLNPGPPITTPDTLRAIILVTLSPNGIAHARMGFIVRQSGKPVVYLDCRKKALKWPQAGWGYELVGGNNK